MKIGLFVGSFNPVTISHENIALDLLNNNYLDYIYYIPVNSQKKDLISIENRIEMLNLIKTNQTGIINIYDYTKLGFFNNLVLDKIDSKYHIDYIIMGYDLFLKFDTFKDYKKILKKYKLIIIKRGEYKKELIKQYNCQENIIFINKDYPASSKIAKERLNEKNNYLNNKVLDYIKNNNLYI